jgi:hypothetical protein
MIIAGNIPSFAGETNKNPSVQQTLASKETSTPQDTTIISYQKYLKTLDATDRKSVLAARETFLKRFAILPGREADEGFRTFRKFYSSVVDQCSRKYFWPDGMSITYKGTRRKEYQNILDSIMSPNGRITVVTDDLMNKDPVLLLDEKGSEFAASLKTKYGGTVDELIDYRKCGMKFSWGEGDWYLAEDAQFLADTAMSLNGELGDYYRFSAEESKKRLAEDAALLITWEELRRKIIRYENFALNHQSLPETKSRIEPDLYLFMHWYLNGIENTYAYDLYPYDPRNRGTGKIDPELRTSYKNFLKENKDSAYFSLIRDVCTILMKNDFTWNKELEDFLKSKAYDSASLHDYFYKKLIQEK